MIEENPSTKGRLGCSLATTILFILLGGTILYYLWFWILVLME